MSRRVILAILAAGAVCACTIERAGGRDTTESADTAAATPAAAERPGAAAPRTDAAAEPVADTMVGLAPPVPEADARDTTPIVASAAELAELAPRLEVPVQGIARTALHDNFTEARGGRSHEALDILAPRDTPVLSAADGRVLKLHESAAGGHMIYAADASDRFILMYAHLERYAPGLEPGASLRRGQVIGYVGTSGNAPPLTPHLHFAIARGRPSVTWWRGTPVNPYPLLAR